MNYDGFIPVPIYAVVAIVQQQGLVLSASRPFEPGDIGFPGGRVDLGENPERALRRELGEETNVRAGDVERAYEAPDAPGSASVCRAYLVHTWSGTPANVEPGTHVRWATWDELCRSSNTFYDYNRRLRASMRRR